jgi:hypothetical protein
LFVSSSAASPSSSITIGALRSDALERLPAAAAARFRDAPAGTFVTCTCMSDSLLAMLRSLRLLPPDMLALARRTGVCWMAIEVELHCLAADGAEEERPLFLSGSRQAVQSQLRDWLPSSTG